jgi:hypothetical protein
MKKMLKYTSSNLVLMCVIMIPIYLLDGTTTNIVISWTCLKLPCNWSTTRKHEGQTVTSAWVFNGTFIPKRNPYLWTSATGSVLSEYFGFPNQYSFHQMPHFSHLSSGAGTIGLLAASMLMDSVSPHMRIKRRVHGKCAVNGTSNPMFVYADVIA